MKCLKCGVEWNLTSNSDIVACPSCGAIYVHGILTDSLYGALYATVQHAGEENLRNGDALYGTFRDFAPSLKKEGQLLKLFLAHNGHLSLLDAKNKDSTEVRTAAERVVFQMTEDMLHESYCRTIVGAFCKAIGFDLGPAFGENIFESGDLESLARLLKPGIILLNQFEVQSQLELSSTDTSTFLCKKGDRLYTARVYPYRAVFRESARSSLQKIEHPCIARLEATGNFQAYPVEVYPFFECGSLLGKTFSEETLVRCIIPDINEGLHALHLVGVSHGSLKLSNLMLTGDDKHVCILPSRHTVLDETGSKAGKSISSHVSVNNSFEKDDYYAFGIALYELFCGYSPSVSSLRFGGQDSLSVFPKEMPIRLQALITGLTWSGQEKDGHSWGYPEVVRWLSGETPAVPGTEGKTVTWIPEYIFLDTSYTELSQLTAALLEHWEEGKKQLFHGLLADYFRQWNLDLARKVQAAEEAGARDGDKDDLVFWQLLYQIDSKRKRFCWLGREYDSLPALGAEVLNQLWDRDNTLVNYYCGILQQKLLTKFVSVIAPNNNSLKALVGRIEAVYEEDILNEQPPVRSLYLMGYLLSGKKTLLLDGQQICTTGELAAYMREQLNDSYKKFEALCQRLADMDGSLTPQLEAWLLALGKQDELERWSEAMNA